MLPLIPIVLPFVLKYAPQLINALFGPKASEVATSVAQVATKITGIADPASAVQNAITNPALAADITVALAKISAETAQAERQAELETFRAEMANVANARDQTRALAAAGSAIAWAAPVVSVIAVVGFFAAPVVGKYIGVVYPDIWLGAMIAAFTGTFNYWLGASASGRRSQEALVAQTSTAATAAATATANATNAVIQASRPPVVAPALIPPVYVPPAAPMPPWKRYAPDGLGWRVTADGITTEQDPEPMRTVGEPITVANIWQRFGAVIGPMAQQYAVPATVVVTIIATESRGDPLAYRREPDGRESSGLGQALTSTASELMGRAISVVDLQDPRLAVEVTCRYLQRQTKITGLDPILASAGYNAGSLVYSTENRWRLRSTGNHLDRAAMYFGDACVVSARDRWFAANAA